MTDLAPTSSISSADAGPVGSALPAPTITPPKSTWKPTFGEAFHSAYEGGLIGTLGSITGDALDVSQAHLPQDKAFDPFPVIQGTSYEQHARAFVGVQSPAQFELTKRSIDRETANRETLAQAGWTGFAAQLAAGAIDPVNLLAGELAAPAKGISFLGAALKAGGVVGGVTAAQETALDQLQATRTLSENAENVLGATAFAGLIGGAVHALPHLFGGRTAEGLGIKLQEEVSDLTRSAPGSQSGGDLGSLSAAAANRTTFEQEGMADALGTEHLGLSPLGRTRDSPSADVRRISGDLAETPYYLRQNDQGIASSIAAETLIKQHQAPLAEALGDMDRAFLKYRTGKDDAGTLDKLRIGAGDLMGQNGDKLDLGDFKEQIAHAMRNGDEHPVPEVAEAARSFRSKVFDPLKDAAIEAGLLPEDVTVETADSYLTRLYDVPKIAANRNRFIDEVLVPWLADQHKDAGPRFDAAQEAAQTARATLEREAPLADLARQKQAEMEPQVKAKKARATVVDRDARSSARAIQRMQADVLRARGRLSRITPTEALAPDDPLVTALRDVRRGVPAPKLGPTLLEHVAQNGGIVDRLGDFAAMDADKWHLDRPFRRRLLQEDTQDAAAANLSPDRVAQRAWEAGYIDEPTEDALQDAVREELTGRPVRTVADRTAADEHALRAGNADAFGQHLQALGLDVSKMRDEEVAVRLGSAPASLEEAQTRLDATGVADVTISGMGTHGPVLEGLQGRWDDTLRVLETMNAGDARGVLSHPEVPGDIDVVWEAGGRGLGWIERAHPEVLSDLPERLDRMVVTSRSENRIRLRATDGSQAIVRLDYDGESKTWLMTAFEEEGQPKGGTTASAPAEGQAGISPDRLTGEDIAPTGRQNQRRYVRDTPSTRARAREAQFTARRLEEALAAEVERGGKARAAADLLREEHQFLAAEARGARLAAEEAERRVALATRKLEASSRRMEAERQFADVSPAELRSLADEITDHVTGAPGGRSMFTLPPNARGPLRERTLNIPDNLIAPYLVNDMERVSRTYTRMMAADVELAKKFGRPDMRDQVQAVVDSYGRLKAGTQDGKKQAALDRQMRRDVRDIEGMRDRIRGTYGMPDDPSGLPSRAFRVMRTLNFVRLLGGMTISALPDVGSIVLKSGMQRVIGDGVAPLLTNLKTVKLAAEEVKRAGTALDLVLETRAMQLADVWEDFGRYSKFERGVQYLGEKMGGLSLMGLWNASAKQFAGVLIQTRMLRALEKIAAGGEAQAGETRRLAFLGIDRPMAERIGAEFAAHGESEGGAYHANTTAWTDREAVRVYRAAIVKEVDGTIVTPGQDRPLWISSEMGKVLGQFRSFTFSSTAKVLINGLQQRDHNALQGLIVMVGLGMLASYLKGQLSGNPQPTTPAKLLEEGVDQSGVLGWIMDANNTAEKLTRNHVGINPILAAATGEATPESRRYASRSALETLLGPTAGMINDTATIAADATGKNPDGTSQFGATDVHKARTLLPFQNLFYTRWLFDRAEEATDHSFGLPQKREATQH